MAKIGVAISGGGHRATFFGLGVLLYLADAGENRNVVSISSVSGGSITNGYVGLKADYTTQSSEQFRELAGGLARQIASRGTLFAWAGTRLYIITLVLLGLATFAVWLLPWHWLARLGLFVAALALWDLLLVRRRGEICGRAYAATLFRQPSGSPPGLSSISREGVDHVICATHLHAGEHVYFSGRFVYSYRFGWGTPGDLPLHVAVQASTALPGGFPPRWIRSGRFGFDGGAERVPKVIALSDGGVYDNMADQWLSGLARRRGVPPHVQRPALFVIANASASMEMQPTAQLRIPLLGEVAALKRNSSIMYDNSASLRKRDLIDRFDAHAAAAEMSGGQAHPSNLGVPGALLDIRSDPFAAAEFFAGQGDSWPGRAARARAALERKPEDWRSDGTWAASVKTTLRKLGVETSARLLRHGYSLAAMNLHVFHDMPLVDVPPVEYFTELCQ